MTNVGIIPPTPRMLMSSGRNLQLTLLRTLTPLHLGIEYNVLGHVYWLSALFGRNIEINSNERNHSELRQMMGFEVQHVTLIKIT